MSYVRFLVAAFVWQCVLCAQSNLATIGGVITDPSSRTVPGANISLRSAETGIVRSAAANPAGAYQMPGLAPGEYSIEASALGFATGQRIVHLEVGQNARADFKLTIGEQRTVVVAEAKAETLKTEDASIGEVVEAKSVRELPLNGRMLLDLALTVPGSHMSHGAQSGDMNPLYWRPGQNSALAIGGNRPNANYFLVDGVTNTDPTFNTQNLSLSPDAVREFQVQTGSYSAELGGAGGGQINVVTRGGTSTLHATVYEFLRNGALDARSFNEMEGGRFLVQNNFGAAVGGPLYGRKTFFFGNFEGLRQVRAHTMIRTVPSPEAAAGDFSQAGVNIFNPFSVSGGIRAPFPENRIPASLLSRAATGMLKYVPHPNTEDMGGMTMSGQPLVVGAGNDANNYIDQRNARNTTNQGTFRLDRVFARGDSLALRYSGGAENGFMPENLPGFGLNHDNFAHHASVAWTQVLSPRLIGTTALGFSRLSMSHFQENAHTNDIVTQLGIQGVNFGGPRAWGAPYFDIQGYTPIGDTYQATPMQSWDTIVEGRQSFSWQKGNHGLKFGASYRRFIWPMWAYVLSRGLYQFTSGFTSRTASSDGTGSALASFLLELPTVRQRQVGSPRMNLRQWYADAFIQDTWRLSPVTTLNIGLRYEYMSPLVDISNDWAGLYVTPSTLTAYIGGQFDTPRGLLHSNKLRFAPRFGLAHQLPNRGLVFRAGFGIFYTPIDMNTWCNMLHNAPIIFAETNQSDAFTPSIASFNFAPAVLGTTVTSFSAFDPYQKPQYVTQWNAAIEKSLGPETVVEIGYQAARGFHLQRSHLINNARPGPGLVQPRRPYQSAAFLPGTVFPPNVTVSGPTFRISALNWLENTAQSWYDSGYVNLRRRYSKGVSLLVNYTLAKNLSDAPDFRSPMFEAAIPQNNYDLRSEKGPACDIRHRFALSAVYDVYAIKGARLAEVLSRNWQLSAIYQVQSGFPFTISVFGDTANAGTVLGEHPVRANYTGQPVFTDETRRSEAWFNPAAFSAPPAYSFGNLGRNTVFGPGMQTLDMAVTRSFGLGEKARFTLRLEAFNALNKLNLGTPNRFVNTAQFGTITESSTPGRVLQIGARITL